ncbi:MAG: nucleotidyltransferase family protein [Terracidiphilus sp.]|jgi:hypothetical protein
MQSLLDLLRGRLQNHSLDQTEFDNLLHVAEQENLLLYAAELLRRSSVEFAPEQEKRLVEIHRQGQIAAMVWTESLKNTLAAFHRVDLPVIALKGPCLAERIYGDASLRTCYDLDLLVRRADLARAEQLLTDIGFSPNSHADDYHRPWNRKGINLELHHNVENPRAFEFDMEAVWSRAQISRFRDAPVWLLAPPDELLYLCLHGVRHRFERLCLILDLALAFRRLPLAGFRQLAWGNPVSDNIFVLGCMIAVLLDPELASEVSMPQTGRVAPAEHDRLEQLAGRLWQEVMLAPPPTLDWAAQHRFYLELETPGWNRVRRRWRHSQILLTRLIDDDFVFAGRFHLHRSWQVRMLRPVRLLMKTLRPSPRVP